uniref:Immunoglobulin V-set domain-containing protein n=1 Tax=Pelusios castaneus TaxID=367368 RepID=A0A8C8RHR3_9SAUR
LLLSLFTTADHRDSVNQTQATVIVSQGNPVLLTIPYLFWYVQYPNQPPRLFLRDMGRENSDDGIMKGFSATHQDKDTSFHLGKQSSDLNDSATYYCAVSNTVTGTSSGSEQKPLLDK